MSLSDIHGESKHLHEQGCGIHLDPFGDHGIAIATDKEGGVMRIHGWIAGISLVLGTTLAAAQPPKAAAPRNLPDAPAASMPEKTATEEKAKNTPALIKVKVPE